MFAELQCDQIMRIKVDAVLLYSNSIKANPDGTGAQKKRPTGRQRIAWRMKHQDSYCCRRCSNSYNILASPSHAHDAPEGRSLLGHLGDTSKLRHLLMDRAYEGD
jgi:hypothetical protein